DVKRIAFTGSVPTGLLIQRRAAESGHVKHVSLELGGKNAMVVFPDVDVEEAVEGAIFGMNFNVCQGQSCGSNSRVLVHRRAYEEFVRRSAEKLAAYRVGVAYDEATDMGPLVSTAHHERVSVWTNDLDLAHRTAERLDAGYVWINDSTRHYFGTPFGGTKDSGVGREESIEELTSYLEQTVVHTRLRDPHTAFARLTAH